MRSKARWRGEVRLGEMKLFWCPSCGLPVIKQRICPRCGEETKVVKVTPPGDVRPSFEGDIRLIREVVKRNFGERASRRFVEEGEALFINRAPSTDLHHEIVAGGEVIGSVIYDVLRGQFRLSLREGGAARILKVAERGVITVDEGAKSAILERGGSLLHPGVLEVRGGVEEGEEAILIDESGTLFAVGHATKSLPPGEPPEGRGMVVKIRWRSPTPPSPPNPTLMTLEEIAEANKTYLLYLEERATNFIKEVIKSHPELPVVVSYSGGKDSLATLLLLLEAGIKPKVIFINTGLEFPETINNVREMERRYNLEVLEATPTADFYSEVEHFGPPGRDYRFCCKSLKLGPVVRLIHENFPGGVLSFIGQRRYESRGRMEKGEVWENPWVPGQLGASPIQNWSALEVFLYLTLKGAPINPLYRMGLDRIGCWLCPASDMGDLKLLEGRHPDWERWEEILKRWAEESSLPKEVIDWGVWRFRRPPKWLKNLAEGMGVHLPEDLRRGRWGMLEVRRGEGGVTVRNLRDERRFLNILRAVGDVSVEDNTIKVQLGEESVVIKKEGVGAYSIEGADPIMGYVKSAVIRSQECVHCGICPGRCPTGALQLKEGGIEIEEERCVSCRLCLEGPCPAEAYRPSQGFSF